MTTATAAPAANMNQNEGENDDNLLENSGTESLLTGQEGEEVADSAQVEDAMMAGFNRVSGKKPETNNDDTDARANKKLDSDQDDGVNTERQTAEPEDLEVPGLGMKASEVKARLGRLDSLEKTVASANGHIGHLKSLIQSGSKGKAITKESLSKVREEFGDDYAEALAADLTAAGIGGGAAVDEETLGRIVGERMATERESMSQDMEKRLVRARHSDAIDYFQGGKHNAEFVQFVGTLPKDRQDELANTWDSGVINNALDEFKAHKTKVANDQTKQQRRIERSVMPTASRGNPVQQPTVDPIEAGWNNVKGRGRGNSVGTRR